MNGGAGGTNRQAALALALTAVLTAAAPAWAGPETPSAASAPSAATEADEAPDAIVGMEFSAVLQGWIASAEAGAARLRPEAPHAAAPIGPGDVLREGSKGARAARLAARLVETGNLAPEEASDRVTPAVQSALAAWQEWNGIGADGKAGDETVSALDRQPAEAAAALEAAAEGMRSFSADPLLEGGVVNLASQQLIVVHDGRVALAMDVAVGRPARQTPLLTDKIVSVIVNPTWTVPPTVMAKDKLPHLRRSGTPGIRGASIFLDGEAVDPAAVDWSTVSPGRMRIVQSPGDHNALGRLKFDLTNPYSIYMHDTNEPKVFDRTDRAVSSGCVRLSDPMALAQDLLGRQGWDSERIEKAIRTGSTQHVALAHPFPVRFVYWTAKLVGDGTAAPTRDVYGRNRGSAVKTADSAAPEIRTDR